MTMDEASTISRPIDSLHTDAAYYIRSNEHEPKPVPEAVRELPRGVLFAAATLTLLGGLAAIIFPLTAAVTLEILFGITLVLIGISQLVCAARMNRWKGASVFVAGSVVALLAGGLLLSYPLAGVVTLAVLIGSFLLAGGILRMALSLRLRPDDGWGYLLANGVAAILLGGFIMFGLPSAAGWFLGLMVGFDLLANSGWLFTLATRPSHEA